MTKQEAIEKLMGLFNSYAQMGLMISASATAQLIEIVQQIDSIEESEDGNTQCRGCFSLGNACGQCQKCKSAAFDWICSNSTAMDEWAVLRTGYHDIMRAIMQQCRKANP